MEKTKRALVLGAGASGAASALFLHARGWSVTVADTRAEPKISPALEQALGPRMQLLAGRMDVSLLEAQTDLVVISPGLSPEFSAAAPICQAAQNRGIDVVGEIELFARELCRLAAYRGYRPIVLGITGTNGKTTTTTLVGKMCQACGKTVCVAGNIGPNALSELDRCNRANALPQVWVLELSSFQLQTTRSLHCTAAVFLNLTEDHVDWHGSMQAYGQAKARIFAPDTVRIVNRDDAASAACATESGWTFGLSAPETPGTWGLAQADGLTWLAMRDKEVPASSKKAILAPEPPQTMLLMPEEALQIRGRHNAMNALAALALVHAAELPLSASLEALKHYKGEAHRVQKVLEVNGIDFIDDSKGTNVGAVMAALGGLGGSGQKSVLILGGDGKGQNFDPLREPVEQYARAVILIGRDRLEIDRALCGASVPVIDCGTDFELAVQQAYQCAHKGDAVLLSPACASWDMFANYAERSARFVQVAKSIAERVQEQP